MTVLPYKRGNSGHILATWIIPNKYDYYTDIFLVLIHKFHNLPPNFTTLYKYTIKLFMCKSPPPILYKL